MLRVALFGAGRIGQVHAASAAEHAETELACVCDPDTTAAEDVTARFGGRPCARAEEVFADSAVDAVVIAAPTPVHLELLSRAARSAKPVLCEKPIDLDLDRIAQARTALGGHESRVMTGFNRRFDPSFRQIRQRVAAGEVGTLRQLRLTSRDPHPPAREYLASSGGIFRDMTIHDFDMARYFLGEVVQVQAMVAADERPEFLAEGDVHQAMIVLRGQDGALCQIVNSRSCPFGYDQRLEAFGDTGMLEAANQLPSTVRFYGAQATESASPYLWFFLERYRAAYRAEFAEFVDAVVHDRRPSPDFSDGHAAMRVAEAAIRSAASGIAVACGPDQRSEV